jgi:transcriptional antiterminator NusG
MNYYAIQVKTRSENKYIKLFNNRYPDFSLPLYFPQRELSTMKKGRLKKSLYPLFPGYIFIETENEEDILINQYCFRNIEGFYRFLKSNQEIIPLTGHSLDIVLHFIKKVGQIAGSSKVYFDEKSRIVVTEGPLKGLEGIIIKVDKRKSRAKISLDLYNDSFSIDLAFEVIEPLKANLYKEKKQK